MKLRRQTSRQLDPFETPDEEADALGHPRATAKAVPLGTPYADPAVRAAIERTRLERKEAT